VFEFLAKLFRVIAHPIESFKDACQHFVEDRIQLLLQRTYKRAKEAGFVSGTKTGKAEGNKEGLSEGLRQGAEIGYRKGLEHGTKKWKFLDQTTIPRFKTADNSLYSTDTFHVTAEMEANMRQEVRALVDREEISPPTPEQWHMILSASSSTNVLAGAGSGKSTTLILRIIFMLKHIGIPSQQITVHSFTRASCLELRHTLSALLPHWGIELSDKILTRMVCTFHSSLLRVARDTFSGILVFEHLKSGNTLEMSEDEDVENPLTDADVGIKQTELIKEAYRNCYQNPEFRAALQVVIREHLTRSTHINRPRAVRDFVLQNAARRDRALIRYINQQWKAAGHWPVGLIENHDVEFRAPNGIAFRPNAIVPGSNTPVFFSSDYGVNEIVPANSVIPGTQDRVSYALVDKRNIVGLYMMTPYIFVDKVSSANAVKAILHNPGSPQAGVDPVLFEFKLDGDLAPALAYESLYRQGSFIENLGITVPYGLDNSSFAEEMERNFANALNMFWRELNDVLGTQGIITFNRLFALFTEPANGRHVSGNSPSIRRFQHLLIDEFQDISPQIAHWLTRYQMALKQAGHKVSIMAIGDDWQSIYGWRGSAPAFFINFDKYFQPDTRLGHALILTMQTNFRSIPDIVDRSMNLVERINQKTNKDPVSGITTGPDDTGIETVDLGDNGNIEDSYAIIVERIVNEHHWASQLSEGHKNKVIVMSRSRAHRDAVEKLIEERLGEDSGVVFFTYHGAKGLQGEVAVMIGDCAYDSTNHFRNQIYQVARLGNADYSYDDAMTDETFRLGYVGVTRGRRRTIWFAQNRGGAFGWI
jgi:superfamily I DNA/RNA helicase